MDTKHTITTRYIGPSNTKGARIACYCTLGDIRKVYPYDYGAQCAHTIAALLHLKAATDASDPCNAEFPSGKIRIIAKGELPQVAHGYCFTLSK